MVAPSTAVRPAIASTARPALLPQRGRGSSAAARISSASTRERRIELVGNRRDDRVAPALGAGRDDQQQPAALVRAHRDRELHQHVDRIAPRRRRVEAEERRQQRRAIGQARRAARRRSSPGPPSSTAMLANLVCSPPRCCLTTSRPGAATSSTRQYGGSVRVRAPHRQPAAVRPHAEVDARALDRRARPWPAPRASAAARRSKQQRVRGASRARRGPAKWSGRSLPRGAGWSRTRRR